MELDEFLSERITDEKRRRDVEQKLSSAGSQKKTPELTDCLTELLPKLKAEDSSLRLKNFLDYLPPKKASSVMSDLQDKLDCGEITPQKYHDQWDAEIEENERLHPGIHDRLFEKLMAKYPGPY